MALDLQQELQQAHAWLDQLPLAKLGAVRSLLEVMIDDDDEELTEEDRRALQTSLDSIEKHGTVSMEEVLADFGLTMDEFEKMSLDPDPVISTNILSRRHSGLAQESPLQTVQRAVDSSTTAVQHVSM